MKKILLPLLLLLAITASAQYNNSWIDYSKTYYIFKVSADGLYRIPQSSLAAAGLTANADQYQLWRNGKQVRIFTSVNGSPLGSSDFIEFWGLANDGKPDLALYKDPAYQLSDKYSLFTDTASYFLTVNSAGGNLRYSSEVNPAPGSATPDPFFMRDVSMYYKNRINNGVAQNLGELIYSSSYDDGEGWMSNDISPQDNFVQSFSNLNVYSAGPANGLTVKVNAFGNAGNYRRLKVTFNGDSIFGDDLNLYMSKRVYVPNLNLSRFSNLNTATVGVAAVYPGLTTTDRIAVASISLNYPATFNFNNSKNFNFTLAASADSRYLQIDNFNTGGVAPVLYNLTEGKRYVGDITTFSGKVLFVLPASSLNARDYILVNAEPSNRASITALASKTFFNLGNSANQGDYLTISNPLLYNDGTGINYVEKYRQYRASAAGGSFTAKIYDIAELTDQFAFGIPHHPASIRDFILNATDNWTLKPKFVFIIGRGISYVNLPGYGNQPAYRQTDLVPTFGWPASDILLSARPGLIAPVVPIGRLSAINGNEVKIYFQKMLEYELAQNTPSPLISDKAWNKNFMHVAGGKTQNESDRFVGYLNELRDIAVQPMMGAHVETFTKNSSATIEQVNNARISQYFAEGLTFINYFGHSSANTFEFNLNNPSEYNNQGKYPFFSANGCNAGNYFNYDPARVAGQYTLSETYILAPERGSIGFLASTHFGLEQYLVNYLNDFYNEFTKNLYGQSVGVQLKKTIENLGGLNPNTNFITRLHLEENLLQGDPALKINYASKPDYAIEESLVKISPNIVTVADNTFKLNVQYVNLGKGTNDSIWVSIKRILPDNSTQVIYNKLRLAPANSDSVSLDVPIVPTTDKGLNKIIVSLDYTNRVNELFENNNDVTKEFYIFEDELRPVYPYNFAIVNTPNIVYSASTANPLSTTRQYLMEIDTTETFNSTFKKTYNASGPGGLIQFSPSNISYSDSTVYYWRVAIQPIGTANIIWNISSFLYINQSTTGFAQAHYYQQQKSFYNQITLGADRKLNFKTFQAPYKMTNGLYPPWDYPYLVISNGVNVIANWGTSFNTLQFAVLDGNTGQPLENTPDGSTGAYGSTYPSVDRHTQFEFPFATSAQRKKIMDFLDAMPANATIIVYPLINAGSVNAYIDSWKNDAAIYGSGNDLYHRFYNNGFTQIDSFTHNIPFVAMYSKNGSFPTVQKTGTPQENIQVETTLNLKSTNGDITSPYFGPAKNWTMFHWNGGALETPTSDTAYFEIYGSSTAGGGTDTKLATVYNFRDTSIAFINAQVYPFLKVKMINIDREKATPYQLKYIMLNGGLVAEGAVAPNIAFNAPDSVFAGDSYNFSLAFKNISPVAFDSLMKVRFIITDRNNVPHNIAIPQRKLLLAGDTLMINYSFGTAEYPGANTLFVEVNPDNHQPEQYHFNNILYKNFYAKDDKFNPALDVTFDAVHILNRDIVASRPSILIKLKDENRFASLKDTSLLKVQVMYPDQSLHNFNFNNDTMRFIPAVAGSGDNTATIELKPYFQQDGEYQLIVSGKDVSGNKAGELEYKIVFTVINKPMISNLLNYPNPFTTSTAFVFTLTGSEIPQNMRIQILTITGKVVREITQNELGPIHIGRNITDFKWDGTDMSNQKLANGVYLYRILTNLNGKSLDKYQTNGDNTDKYFNKGYGKMYLLR